MHIVTGLLSVCPSVCQSIPHACFLGYIFTNQSLNFNHALSEASQASGDVHIVRSFTLLWPFDCKLDQCCSGTKSRYESKKGLFAFYSKAHKTFGLSSLELLEYNNNDLYIIIVQMFVSNELFWPFVCRTEQFYFWAVFQKLVA